MTPDLREKRTPANRLPRHRADKIRAVAQLEAVGDRPVDHPRMPVKRGKELGSVTHGVAPNTLALGAGRAP